MASENRLIVSLKTISRYKVINQYEEGRLTRTEVSSALGISERQVTRLVKSYRKGGVLAMEHGTVPPTINKTIAARKDATTTGRPNTDISAGAGIGVIAIIILYLIFLPCRNVSPGGLEPSTNSLRGSCSTS